MGIAPPDPERVRAARRQFRLQKARERLDEALGRELERLELGERIELALRLGRDVVGFALRDTLEVRTRYALAPSYSAPLSERAGDLAHRAEQVLLLLDEALTASEALLAIPEQEWKRWSPAVPGQAQPGAGGERPNLPESED